MAKAILKKQPSTYWQQQRRECGAYVMKALLNMYGKDGDEDPGHYLSPVADVLYGYTWPHRIKKVLARYSLYTEFHRPVRLKRGKLNLLKDHLLKQEPLIVLVGSSFSKKGIYRHFRRWFRHHWVLVLGFDDEKKQVYLYDPKIHPSKHQDVPIGNVALSYRMFMRQWRGVFLTGIVNYIYMPVKEIKKFS